MRLSITLQCEGGNDCIKPKSEMGLERNRHQNGSFASGGNHHQRYSTTSSTSCTTGEKLSRNVASFRSHGFRALENTFSPRSSSVPRPSLNGGRRRFQINPVPPHTTRTLYLFFASRTSRSQTQNKAVGLGHFLALWSYRSTTARRDSIS